MRLFYNNIYLNYIEEIFFPFSIDCAKHNETLTCNKKLITLIQHICHFKNQ